MTTVTEAARAAMRIKPNPPRRVPFWPFLVSTYWSAPGIALAGFALVLGLPLTLVGLFFIPGPPWQRAAFVAVYGLITAVIGFAPAIGALRFWRAVRIGVVARGEILTVHWAPPELRPVTVDAGRNGFAHGKRRVFYPNGAQAEAFESDAPWSSELKSGTKTRLLVHPTRRQVLLDLGPDNPDA